MSLPRIFLTADEHPFPLADWSFSSTADLGYDRIAGVAAGRAARRFTNTIDQGAVLKAYTEQGVVVWEGEVPQPPKLTQDGLVRIVGQGYGYQAAKSSDRVTPVLTAPGVWVAANTPPLNFQWGPAAGGGVMTILVTNSPEGRQFEMDNATAGSLTHAVAFWARGMTLKRFRFTLGTALAASDAYRIRTADGPEIGRTSRVEYVIPTASGTLGSVHDVTFSTPGDCVIIERYDTGGSNVANGWVIQNPVVYGAFPIDAIYSQHAALIVASQLGWDTSQVIGRGAAPHYSLDSTNAASILSYVAGLEDCCWGAWADEGAGPVLSFGPYGARNTWEVSAATGAHWDLDPLERVRRATIQFLNVDNTFNEFSMDSTDPALPDSVQTEVVGSLADQQDNPALAIAAADKMLHRFLEARYRGRITFARAFEAGTRREATYEVRAGDLIRITDFAVDGSITLRVHDVEMSPSGVVVGVEAPAFPAGGLGAPAGGGGGAVGPALSSTTDGTATYVPPGSGVGGGGGQGGDTSTGVGGGPFTGPGGGPIKPGKFPLGK